MPATNFRLFATDLDGTILGHDQAAQQFKTVWEQLEPTARPLLCYNSGRLLDDVLVQIKTGLLTEPDYIISGVGTSIYDFRARTVLKAFTEILEEGWDKERVEQILPQLSLPLEKQPTHYQHLFKSSWYFNDATPDDIEAIQAALEAADLETHVIYSSGRHLDILPKWANKGNALRWLLRHLKIPAAAALVAGDSGNDSAMFAVKGVSGIVVGNAQPELREQEYGPSVYVAPLQEICGRAVLQGLHYHGVVKEVLEVAAAVSESILLYEALRTSGDETVGPLTKEQMALIRQGYHRAIEALKKCITPLGFSACSLEDNEVVGTDENYRSIWARDGSLTLLGSLPLLTQDEAIHTCQRQTLQTLLRHISPNGQIPANVRLQDERPDYSGVGGIASIDSGLWVIIAFMNMWRKPRILLFYGHTGTHCNWQ